MKTLMYGADGRKRFIDEAGNTHPYRWYHALGDAISDWWLGRHFRRRQKEFKRTKTRYYGDGGTIHNSTHLDVEIGPDGHVCAVWFRCQPLPFKECLVNKGRAAGMREMYEGNIKNVGLCGVEIKDYGISK